jgi:hypothetical protein
MAHPSYGLLHNQKGGNSYILGTGFHGIIAAGKLKECTLFWYETVRGDTTMNKPLGINCLVCGNEYLIRVTKEGQDYRDFGIVCCIFCGQQTKLYSEVKHNE